MQKETQQKQSVQHQKEHMQEKKAKQYVFTNVDPNDRKNGNGITLTLKDDHTFNFYQSSSSWMSDSEMWSWDNYFYIDGVWSYDKELKIITITATKFSAALQDPLQNQQEVLQKGFPNRVLTTSNFDIQSSKEIKSFCVRWDFRYFKSVSEGILKRK